MYMGSVPLLSCYTTVSWRIISAVLRCDVLPTTHLQGLYAPPVFGASVAVDPVWVDGLSCSVRVILRNRQTDRSTDTPLRDTYRTSIWPRVVKTAYFTKFTTTVTRGRGSVLLRRQRSMPCVSGFVDDVMFSHMGHISHLRLWQAVCPCFRIFEFRTGDKVCYPRLPCITCT